MIRLALSIATLILAGLAAAEPGYGLHFFLYLLGATGLSAYVMGGFFSFFLCTGLLAFVGVDMDSDSALASIVLPLYTGFSLCALLVGLVLMYPKLLGQQVKSSDLTSL